MPYSTLAKNTLLNHLGTLAVYVSLHNADPGGNGGNEISGGSPAYARKTITWNAASGGEKTASNMPIFDVPAQTWVRFVGLWSAVSGGNFYGSADVNDVFFANQGTCTLDSTILNLNAGG